MSEKRNPRESIRIPCSWHDRFNLEPRSYPMWPDLEDDWYEFDRECYCWPEVTDVLEDYFSFPKDFVEWIMKLGR